jgi:DNA polymerase-3 subunit chi
MSAPEPVGAPSVAFYVLEEASAASRLKLVCRITDKAYRAGQQVLIWNPDTAELASLDELLWTFGDDRSFIPHELFAPGAAREAPVLLSAGPLPEGPIEVLVNLSPTLPPCVTRALRVVEVVDGEERRREAARSRFKAYRELGLQPQSHHVRGGEARS